MNESTKTIVFVGIAVVLAALAGASHFSGPTNSADFEMVGKEFYEEFTSGNMAESLEVSAVDAESGRLRRFSVEKQDGLWRIPSHYNYPAEAAVRLAQTASSFIGISRDSLEGRLVNEQERLGVLDPLEVEIEDPESAGKRITLKDADGEVVVDYIIGNEVEGAEVVLSEVERPFGANQDLKYYYVRRPDEKQTYKVALNIDLSTKFSDWIDPDLLRVERNEVTKISIDNYSIEEDRSTGSLMKMQSDVINLSRESGADPWVMDSLNAETEELNESRVTDVINVLDELKIAGVRPKLKFKDHVLLTQELKLNVRPEFKEDPRGFERAMSMLQAQLDQKGFNLAGSSEKMELVSQHGQLDVGTENGVLYTLHVGKPIEGDEKEIEIGSLGSSDDEKKSETEKANAEGDADTKADESKTDESKDKTESGEPAVEAKNRYMMVRVSLDESLLGEKPVLPTAPKEPVKPEGYTPVEEKPKDEKEADVPDDVEKPEGVGEEKKEDEKPARDPRFTDYDNLAREYEQEKVDYELAISRFEDQTKEYEKKVADGNELVEELNQRFGDWYYVISGDNLATLQTKREDLATKKEPPAGGTPAAGSAAPARPNINFPPLPGAGDGIQDAPMEKEAPAGDKTEPATENETPAAEEGKEAGEAGKEMPEAGKELPAEKKAEPGSEKQEPAVDKMDADTKKADPKSGKLEPMKETPTAETKSSGSKEETPTVKEEASAGKKEAPAVKEEAPPVGEKTSGDEKGK